MKSTSYLFFFFVIIIFCREDEKCRVAYKAIMSIHPHLPGIVKACAEYPDTFGSLINMVSPSPYMRIYAYILILLYMQVESASSGARGDDTSKLRDGILTFMFEDSQSRTAGFHPDLQQDRLIPGTDKSLRGWAYIETAYLLCPERYLDEFKADPEYILFFKLQSYLIICY